MRFWWWSALSASVLLAACGSANQPVQAGGGGSGAAGATGAAGTPVAMTCGEAGLTEAQCAALSGVKQSDALKPARGNEHAESFDAALFGFHVFFDARFSKNLKVRCESCHSVDSAFTTNEPTATEGVGPGQRNSPTIFNAARYDTYMWDGKADTLWSQPLLAFENPDEMGFSRLEIAHLLQTLYGKEYAAAFGPLPDVSDLQRFPEKGAPGDTAFDQMTADDQHVVNGIAANLGKALEAYMRKIATGPSPVDRFLGGQQDALSDTQRQGMFVFASSGCLDCHGGSQLSDNTFHNLGVPAAAGQAPDPGQAMGMLSLQHSMFNEHGPFFDGTPSTDPEPAPVLGGFRTPSLRNLAKSAPYGHNGTFPTLESIVDFHLKGGGVGQTGFVGDVDPQLAPRDLSVEDRGALIEFLKALTGDYPALPWGQWPNGNG